MVNSISMCRLFAMTPRAGPWNHRYLVPRGMDRTERELAELVSRADARPMGTDYIAVVRTVTQPSTGRRATEVLILTDPRLTQLDPQDRDEVVKKLREYSDRLEDLVTRQIDWQKVGAALVVEHEQLGEWQRKLDGELRARVRPSLVSSNQSAEALNQSGSSRSRLWTRRWVAALVLLVPALAAIMWSDLSIKKLDETLREYLDKTFQQQPSGQQLQQYRDHLANILADLIEWHGERPTEHEKREKAIEIFYKWVYNKEVPDAQTQSTDVKRALMKLRAVREEGKEVVKEDDKNFDPLGLLEKEQERLKETARNLGLDKIDPAKLRECFRRLRKLRDLEMQPDKIGTGNPYGKALDSLNQVCPRNSDELEVCEGPEPRFYVRQDVQGASVLRDVLSSDRWRDLIASGKEKTGSAGGDSLAELFRALHRARGDQSSPVASKNFEPFKKGADTDVKKWYDTLDNFCDACAKAASEKPN